MAADVTAGGVSAPESGVTSSATEAEGPTKTWYYLVIVFLVLSVVYMLSVLALDSVLFLSFDALGLLLWIGLLAGWLPLTLFLWFDTRAVARANRNPAFVRRSLLLRPWLTGGGELGVGTLVRALVAVVVGVSFLFYELPFALLVLWYLGSTRRKALRTPETDEETEDAYGVAEEYETEEDEGDEKEKIAEKEEDVEEETLPPLPPNVYQRAKQLKQTGNDREATGAKAVSDDDYAVAATAYAEAVDAYAKAVELVDGYAVDDSALRSDLERARTKHEETTNLRGKKDLDEYLAEARAIAHRGDERYANGDLDGAIEQWTAAAAVYDRAVTDDVDEDAGDLRTLAGSLRAKVVETERERDTAVRQQAEMTADEALSRGREALEDGDYEGANAAFGEAVEALATARDIARERDDDAAYLDDTRREVRRGVVDATLGALEAELAALHDSDEAKQGHRGGRVVLDRVRRGLNDLEASSGEVFTDGHRDRVARLRERVVLETLGESVNGQLAEMQRAERLYADEKFFEAREVFRRVRANVGTLASEHAATLTEEVDDELSRIQLACEMNAETITKAIHDEHAVEPLVTVANIADGEPRPSDSDTIIDKVLKANLPGYTRGKHLGGGGFADIWVVKSTGGKEVVKIPRVSNYETIPESKIRRFVAEAENWQLVASHPNVVDIHQYGEKPVPWLLLELCEGTLRDRLEAAADFDERVAVLAAVGDALGYANAKGIAHLDIKPENVLFDADGTPKLGDWGLSKVMTEGSITVTGHSRDYAAPEQRNRTLGERDIRTDVYQYGVLAYELLTGKHPFIVGSPEAVVPPSEVNSELPPSVDTTLLKAMAFDQTERYEQVVQVRDALTRALGVEA